MLALRTVVLLGVGFAILADRRDASPSFTPGLRELASGMLPDVRALADALERNPLGPGAGDAQLRLALFRAKDPDIAFVAAGTDACRSTCIRQRRRTALRSGRPEARV